MARKREEESLAWRSATGKDLAGEQEKGSRADVVHKSVSLPPKVM